MRLRGVRLVLLTVLVIVASGCDWTMFGLNPAHTRANNTESAISVGNVANLTRAWTGHTASNIGTSPAVVNGVVYVGGGDGVLYAFDEAGAQGCSGTPTLCTALWTSGASTPPGLTSPAVVNGVVYVGSQGGKLYAFDAAGSKGCSGSPKTCAPLWSGATGGTIFSSAPNVVNGVVYIGSGDHKLYAFDAAGSKGCSGTPKTCAPLWTATTGNEIHSSPAVANGLVYVGSWDHKLYAFDAAGSRGCSGIPKTCAPLWTATTGSAIDQSSPAVVNGVLYVGSDDGLLYAFDAAGSTGCSGTPKTCAPLWTATFNDSPHPVISSPAVANGVVYMGAYDGGLYAFDAAGVTGCSGIPKTCAPLWIGADGGVVYSSPAIANGVAYVYVNSSPNNAVYAFDAAGSVGCSATPKVCAPLWGDIAGSNGAGDGPVVANGAVYVGSGDSNLYVFKPANSEPRRRG